MWNPLELKREPIATALAPEQAAAAIDAALAIGVSGPDWHRGCRGWRRGDSFELSLRQLRSSETAIARGRIERAGHGSLVRVSVGLPMISNVVTGALGAFLLMGALNQVYIQLFGAEVPMGGRLAGLMDTLQGIGFLFAVVVGLLLFLRWRLSGMARSHEAVLRIALQPLVEPAAGAARPID